MKRLMALSIFLVLVLSGCMYPAGELSQNQIPNEMQLQSVQLAVEQYRENNNGLIPILTKPNETPIFQKYIIDFSQLKNAGLITDIPGTAFENGGIYQYVLLSPEDNPTVKLIDLRIARQLREVEYELQVYRSEHIYPPFGEEIAEGVYQLNHKELGLDTAPFVESPYSDNHLPVVLDVKGDLYVDYSADLYAELQSRNHDYQNGDDIRYLLTENSPIVPVYSLPYTVDGEEPVFMVEAD